MKKSATKLRVDPSRVIFEDNHILAYNKKAGELVQGDITGDDSLLEALKSYIKEKYQKPGNVFLGLPHRLDRPTSGLVLFARTSKALSRLNAMFQSKEINKIYWAIVNKPLKLKSATLKDYLRKNQEKNKSFVVTEKDKGAKLAMLNYHQIAEIDRYALLEVELETGRHHQIRAQLARKEMSIRGDLKYGYPRSNDDGSISLHARALDFIHPVSKEAVKLQAPVPEEKVWKLLVAQVV